MPPPPLDSDRSLLRNFRRGSQDAATQLYFRYAHRVRALVRSECSSEVARRVEPEDLVQSVFRRFFCRVSQSNYDIPPGEELWGLFLVIALNRVRAEENFQRAGKRNLRRDAAIDEDFSLDNQPTEEEDAALLQLTIDEALSLLPEQQRQMVELRIQGHEVAEIAQQTGRSKRTVERNLQEVRKRLRELLGTEGDAHAVRP